ncbi:MAG: hypothetical protein A3H71_03455 [Candidatus Sungbacteria bacterium RIFCSPLOWO2_02_FULL_48_13b]|uniref:Uncharacterized protein n=1 Tax=Candidatus Sungbacteria bacterium RIFCSPLOWO2_02_FULL_48_13b TaxID=1802283 RepID=A0A1G2LF18_9BACT|nr:MAG: hypothetical protein A3H71_03455 [Candidatus Sungbacteria bacterium RIFCSPLOWO2_02_FULL_48_13b]
MENILSMEQLLEKVNKIKASGSFDLSMEEDLSIAVMNLVSLEEHFYFTGERTGKNEYFDLMSQTREIRKRLMTKMIDQHEGETWCITKHLLAATMRLIEVGTKLKSTGKDDEARKIFKDAYEIYSLFWGLRLKLIDISDVKKIENNKLNIHPVTTGGIESIQMPRLEGRGNGVHDNTPSDKPPMTKEEILSKLIDCCKE